MSKSKGSPRKFAEKIALLNKQEAETTAEFKKIIQNVEQIIRAPSVNTAGANLYNDYNQFGWANNEQDEFLPAALPTRSSSFSNWQTQVQQQNNHTNNQPTMNHHLPPYHVRSDQNIQHSGQNAAAFANQANNNSFVRRIPQHERQQSQQQHQATLMDNHSNGVIPINVQQHPTSFRVPNIEIFPIDDEHDTCSRTPIIMEPATATTTTTTANAHHNHNYINGDYLNDCSNPLPISSSRSLPNIADFGAPATSPYEPAGQYMQQVAQSAANQRLAPISDNYSIMVATSRSSDNLIDSNGNYFDGQQRDYCSLPPVVQQTVQQVSPFDRNDQIRRSTTDIQQQNHSWQEQQVMYNNGNTNSAPSSVEPIVQSGDRYF